MIVKRLDDTHRKQCLDHFNNLDRDSLYTRFCYPINQEGLVRYVDNINFNTNGIFGVFNEDMELVGLGECVIGQDDKAEVGFSVLKQHQGKGIGNKLMERIVQFAKSRNKQHLEMNCLRTNIASVHLAKKHGLKIVDPLDSEALAVIDFKDTNPLVEHFNEVLTENIENINFQQLKNIYLNNKIRDQIFNYWKSLQNLTFKQI